MDAELYEVHFPNSGTRELFAADFNRHLHELTLMSFEPAADMIAHKLRLDEALELYGELDSAKLPYHNRYHTECMVANVFEGAVFTNLSPRWWRSIVAATIAHDAFHTGGHDIDHVNIMRAIEFVKAIINTFADTSKAFSDEDQKVMLDVVTVTEYPYVRQPITLPEMIIRDADLMQVYELDDDKLVNQYRGLKQEIEIQRSKIFTNAEFAEGCQKFLDGIVWHTKWARDKAVTLDWETKKDRLITLIKQM